MDAVPTARPQDAALAERLAGRARAALRERRPAEALPALDRLRRLPGQAGGAEAMRAEALLELGRYHEADEAAEAALAGDPGSASRLQLRARAHLACGRRLDAIDAAAAAVQAAPADPLAKALLGATLIEERRFEEAIYFLGLAFEARPDNPLIQLRLAEALRRGGRCAAAEELLDHCVAIAPALPGLAEARATAALAAGDPGRAIRLAEEGLARTGPDAGLYSALAHALEGAGRREEAAPVFRMASRLAPHDPYLAHLAATMAGETTAAATEGYIQSVFDGYAPRFETSLIALGYRVPGLIRRAVERLLPEVAEGRARLGPVLDIGCGTGLVGVALHDLLGGALTGIDLSRRMLDEAAAKGLYTALHHGEFGRVLRGATDRYDLITAGDVFCYIGDLAGTLALCRARLAPGGLLLFSVERGEAGSGIRLGAQGRYLHAPDLVRESLAAAGLEVVEAQEEDLRLDHGSPVRGLLLAARPVRH